MAGAGVKTVAGREEDAPESDGGRMRRLAELPEWPGAGLARS